MSNPAASISNSVLILPAPPVSIRLSHLYDSTKLLHINSHVLFSRFFGESAKNVGKLFDEVLKMSSDERRLVVIIFDEAETLASSRERGNQTSEVADSMRVSNSQSSVMTITHRSRLD